MVDDLAEIVAHHREQSKPNYCVPACACIVLSRLGRQMRQDEICADWYRSGRGYAVQDAAPLLGGRYLQLDPQEPLSIDWLHAQLQNSNWIVASMFAESIAKVVQAMSPPPVSEFGDIWSSGFSTRHATVLVREIEGRFYYLDPFYRDSGQPFSMSRRELAQALQGSVLVVPVG